MNHFTRLCATVGVAVGMLASAHAAFAADSNDAVLLQRGEYLATAGDCIACHSAAAGKPYAGGLAIATPLGKIVSSNITPSKTNGIGNYTLEQFDDALRRGVRADGQHLYPAMPYTAYAQLNDDDVKALYTYFQHGVTAVDSQPAATTLPFPFNIRLSMAAWNLLFLDGKPFVPDTSKSAEWNRGAYLVLGLAHCSACHTPRNVAMAEDSAQPLAGAVVSTWFAPNISNDPVSGIGGWSEAEIAEYLRSGRAVGKAQAAGPMAEAIDNSLSRLTDADRKAIAVYLKAGPIQHHAGDDTQAAYSWGQPALAIGADRGAARVGDTTLFNGAQLYDANCAACHQAHAEGTPAWGKDGAALPSLFHNTALGHANSNNLVMAMLDGVARKSDDVMMPSFRQQLTDQQIATLSNYLLQHYGNPAAKVTVAQVSQLRAGGASSSLLTTARVGIVVAVLLLLLIVLLVARRRRK